MKIEEREQYINLRSRGYSMRGASGAVHVALSTAERWENEAKEEIADKRETRLAALYQHYAVGREDLLIRTAETLELLDSEIQHVIVNDGIEQVRDLERLIRLKLSALSLLDKLHIPLPGDYDGEPTKGDLKMLFISMCKILNVNTQTALESDTEPLEPIEIGTE